MVHTNRPKQSLGKSLSRRAESWGLQWCNQTWWQQGPLCIKSSLWPTISSSRISYWCRLCYIAKFVFLNPRHTQLFDHSPQRLQTRSSASSSLGFQLYKIAGFITVFPYAMSCILFILTPLPPSLVPLQPSHASPFFFSLLYFHYKYANYGLHTLKRYLNIYSVYGRKDTIFSLLVCHISFNLLISHSTRFPTNDKILFFFVRIRLCSVYIPYFLHTYAVYIYM